MTVMEKQPGTLVCQGHFLDDAALWGPNKQRKDKFVVTVGEDGVSRARRVPIARRAPAPLPPPDVGFGGASRRARPGRRITGQGTSHYGDYDVIGTLVRAPDDNYAKIRVTKFKKPKPWYYDNCIVCGDDQPVAALLLCDGQDKTCKNAAHLDCVGLDRVPEGEWFCPACSVKQCKPTCICRVQGEVPLSRARPSF